MANKRCPLPVGAFAFTVAGIVAGVFAVIFFNGFEAGVEAGYESLGGIFAFIAISPFFLGLFVTAVVASGVCFSVAVGLWRRSTRRCILGL